MVPLADGAYDVGGRRRLVASIMICSNCARRHTVLMLVVGIDKCGED